MDAGVVGGIVDALIHRVNLLVVRRVLAVRLVGELLSGVRHVELILQRPIVAASPELLRSCDYVVSKVAFFDHWYVVAVCT